jgi:zinc protease
VSVSERRAAVDRSRPPAPGPVEPFDFPAFGRGRLPGGLEVVAAPIPGDPLVRLEIAFPAGGQYDPRGSAGLATLVGGLLDEGSRERSVLAIASELERMGARMDTGADWNIGAVSVRVLESYLDDGLRLLEEVAFRPAFPDEEIERSRRHRLTDLMRRIDQPGALASDRFQAALYGDTPYGHPLLGRPADVRSITRDEVVAFYDTHYVPSGAVLLAVGSFDPEALQSAVERGLGERVAATGAAAPPSKIPPAIEPPPADGIRVRIVDRPQAAQTELRMGHVGVPRSHPDWTVLGVMDTLFGGKFTSRINLNLRERHGYTYGASSRFTPRLGPGPFVVNAAVENAAAGASVREVLAEMERIRREPVEPEELADTKSYMLGAFPYTLQTLDGILTYLETMVVYGLPDDHYRPERYFERMAAVTREEVLRVAREHLRPEETTVVAVGPAEELVPQMEGLGEVEVVAPPG